MNLHFEKQSTFYTMSPQFTSASIALRIWVFTAAFFAVGISLYVFIQEQSFEVAIAPASFVASLGGSIPVLVSMFLFLPLLNRSRLSWQQKFLRLLLILLLFTIPYGLAAALLDIFRHELQFGGKPPSFLVTTCLVMLILFSCILPASFMVLRSSYYFFNNHTVLPASYGSIFNQLFSNKTKTTVMQAEQTVEPAPQHSNKILIKGLITGALILLMLIPTIFISSLVEEREARQKEVVKEVSSKWATAQTLSAPFLVVPYTDTFLNSDGKAIATKTNLILLANDLRVSGKIIPEQRPRSIYKVLLYKTDINFSGNFKVTWPADVQQSRVDFANAKLCFNLSDFKGIEEEIYINFGGTNKRMVPGMPVDNFGKIGLSVPVLLSPETATAGIDFSMNVKVKGSEQLHFIPLSSASKYTISSSWPGPSFDGEMLPNQRQVSDSGFSARWNFTQANLPFANVMRAGSEQTNTMAFGVSLVQPADQYNKTMRSVKYGILFIGLTFAFFFIIELMQKKPFHPVQYVLVGLALVIFYTLLLAISEYILFDYAYLIAASATILLISFYAKSHFNSWKTGSIFFLLLSCLYAFIFVLIRLEDTALLVGSIGLFIVLALVMFGSRKICWYGPSHTLQS